MESESSFWNRRDFLKVGGTSAAALGVAGTGTASAQAAQEPAGRMAMPAETPYPKLSIITPYSPEKLAFAAQAGYEGVVVTPGPDFNPDLSDTAIERILTTARNAGIRIVSIEHFGLNHTDPNTGKRAAANAEFIRALEFCHRLGCKFVGTFSGGMPGSSMEDQAKAYADVFHEKYLPVCEKLDVTMGWENYPNPRKFRHNVRPRCRPSSTSCGAGGWGWNSTLRISCGSTLTPSEWRGSLKTASSPYTPRIPRSSSRCFSRWELPGMDGGVTASPDRAS